MTETVSGKTVSDERKQKQKLKCHLPAEAAKVGPHFKHAVPVM